VIKDYVSMAFASLSHRKMRSWLTMIGIFIGITAVVAIISLGQGLQVAINEQFNEMGADKIWIQPGTSAFGGASNVVLDESDRRVIDRTQGVIGSVGLAYTNARIVVKDEQVYGLVMGITLDDGGDVWRDMQKNNIENGRLPEKGDTFKAFVGYDYSQDNKLFDRALQLGDKILINGYEFEIIGFQEDMGNSGDNQQVQISDEGYERAFGTRIQDDYMYLIAQIGPNEDPKTVAEDMKKSLRRDRDRDEGDEDFTLQTTEELMDSFNTILLIVQVVIVGIAAVSLVIGGVGIMNTMYTAVVERTQEIGVMKAIGARNSDVMILFLIESGLLGLVGGIVGVGFGLGIAKLVELFGGLWLGTPYLRAWWSWALILGAIGFSFVVGAASGVAPAYQASKQKPVDSLRYE